MGEKKEKKSSEKLANGDGGIGSKAEERKKGVFLRSIAAYLEKNGFSRTLATFLSESQLKLDDVKGHSLNLDDVFSNFLDSSKVSSKESNHCTQEQVVAEGAFDAPDLQKKGKKRNRVDDSPSTLNKHEKKKSKLISTSIEVKPELLMEISCVDQSHIVPKDKKKTKHKLVSGNSNVTTDMAGPEKVQETLAEKSSCIVAGIKPHSSRPAAENDTEFKPKDKKKKRHKPASDHAGPEHFQETFYEKSSCIENEIKPSSQPTADNDTESKPKDKKKKKHKPTSDQAGPEQVKEKTPSEKSSSHETEVKSPSQGILGKSKANNEKIKISEKSANGKDSKGERDQYNASGKVQGEGKHSSEPKSINAFQRVKIDAVEFADERLQDNSYWAKGGADSGYGAKAQEILGQVKGRDFRHEKTKKKRGSYRGGQIDLQSHSIKFNYSDEE